MYYVYINDYINEDLLEFGGLTSISFDLNEHNHCFGGLFKCLLSLSWLRVTGTAAVLVIRIKAELQQQTHLCLWNSCSLFAQQGIKHVLCICALTTDTP